MDQKSKRATQSTLFEMGMTRSGGGGGGDAATTTVSIIGTAGRNEDAAKLNSELYTRMCQTARAVIVDEWKLQCHAVRLVSGGAAWADHVAVQLFLDPHKTPFGGLAIHLPCDLGTTTNPGRVMNRHHAEFSVKIGRDTLSDLTRAQALGATFTVSNGFHARNRRVAESEYVLAFTFGSSSDTPKAGGGTRSTWDKAPTKKKKHVPLTTLFPNHKVKRKAEEEAETRTPSEKKTKTTTVAAAAAKKQATDAIIPITTATAVSVTIASGRMQQHVCDAACRSVHIDSKRVISPDELDEGELENHEREWPLHTVLYREKWEEMKDALEDGTGRASNSTDGEIIQDEWESKNHSLYCCDLRHIAPKCGRMWSE